MRLTRHQYSLAPHTARNTVQIKIGIVKGACEAVEVFTGLLLALIACPVTLAGQWTSTHMIKDMALTALELHLIVDCL